MIEARDAAAPNSNATANETANQYGFDISKKSITWIVEMTETIKYRATNVEMTNPLTIDSFMITFVVQRSPFRSRFDVVRPTFCGQLPGSCAFQPLDPQF